MHQKDFPDSLKFFIICQYWGQKIKMVRFKTTVNRPGHRPQVKKGERTDNQLTTDEEAT